MLQVRYKHIHILLTTWEKLRLCAEMNRMRIHQFLEMMIECEYSKAVVCAQRGEISHRNGLPPRPENTRPVRVTPELYEKIKFIAKVRGLAFWDLMEQLANEWLDRLIQRLRN